MWDCYLQSSLPVTGIDRPKELAWGVSAVVLASAEEEAVVRQGEAGGALGIDRKSTRLNSSH